MVYFYLDREYVVEVQKQFGNGQQLILLFCLPLVSEGENVIGLGDFDFGP